MQNARIQRTFILFVLLLGPTAVGMAQTSEQLRVSPPAPTTQDNVQLIYEGDWQNGCIPQAERITRQGNLFLFSTANRSEICTLAVTPFRATATLGRLSAGRYTAIVAYNGRERRQLSFTVSGSSGPEPPTGDTYESLQREWEAEPRAPLFYRYLDDDGWGTLDIKAWKAPEERFLGEKFLVRLQQGGQTFYGRGEGITWDVVFFIDPVQFFVLSRSGWRYRFEGQLERLDPATAIDPLRGGGTYRGPDGWPYRWAVYAP
jgi:hypothetical protein